MNKLYNLSYVSTTYSETSISTSTISIIKNNIFVRNKSKISF